MEMKLNEILLRDQEGSGAISRFVVSGVHPLYAVTAFVFAIAISVLLARLLLEKKRENSHAHLLLYISVLLFCLQDGVWGLFAAHSIRNDMGLEITSSVFHIASATMPLIWAVFHLTVNPAFNKKQILIIPAILTAGQIGLIVANFLSHFMFYVDENGAYASTPVRRILFYIQFSVYIVIGLITIFHYIRTQDTEKRKELFAQICMNGSPILFGFFQMLYPDAPASSIGFSIACVIYFSFVEANRDRELGRLKTRESFTAIIEEQNAKLLAQQEQLEHALEAEARASNAKTEFLFNMSHDIRTPMNAILGYTDAAIKHRDDQNRVDESLAKIKIAGGHLLNLINDILEMSRIEADKLEITEIPMDIRKLIIGVEQMSSSLAIEKSIDFVTEIGDIRNPYVYSDDLHGNEVLINLLSNAIKYTPEGGNVCLMAEQIQGVVEGKTVFRFTVSDNGIGMSEEFQKHLFEAFSRERTSTVSKQEGAGLGLSIVKRIVDLSGGTISVKSKPNEGSVFTVEIPMRVMDEEAIAKYEAENKPLEIETKEFSFENKKVLLVEDNEMNREIVTEILEEVGLIVDTAEDGQFAVNAVAEKGTEYYDFVLMDIQMPVMNGYEATSEIRKMPGGKRMTIIALSANAFEEDVQKSLAEGMNAHVAKPIDVKVLFETMQRLVK